MNYEIYNEDCLKGMKKIPDGTIDCIIDDLPSGTTDLEVDIKLPLEEMWAEFKRVTKENAAIVLFSQMPFGAELITSNPAMFRHEWIYEKFLPTGFLNANKMPLRIHENILIFYRNLPTYNAQYFRGEPYKMKRNGRNTKNYRRQKRCPKDSDGWRYPTDVLKFPQPITNNEKTYHPQQKPITLLEYLVRTYTNKGETVLDATMGSGSTAVACINTDRKFIGFETSREYFEIAQVRIEEATARRERLLFLLNHSDLKIIEKTTAELIPYENNPRINDGAVDAVAESIKEFGFKVPIVIDSGNVIVAGHTRLKAAKKLGMEKVPCITADDLTPEQVKAFRLIDNKTHEFSTWSEKDLSKELVELTNFNLQKFGFDESEIKSAEISAVGVEENFSSTEQTAQEEFRLAVLLHKKQAEFIREAMKTVGEPQENFGNKDKAGNQIYEIIRQWKESVNENL